MKYAIHWLGGLVLGAGIVYGLYSVYHEATTPVPCVDECHCKKGGCCCCGGTCKPECKCERCNCGE